jgi:hypothetical protein
MRRYTMADVAAGIREGAGNSNLDDPNTDEGFAAALAASVGRDKEPDTLEDRHEARTHDFNASGAEILDYLQNSEEYDDFSTNVKDGLTFASDRPREEPLSLEQSERLTAARRESSPSYQERLEQQRAEAAELAELRQRRTDGAAIAALEQGLAELDVYDVDDLHALPAQEQARLGALYGFMSAEARDYAAGEGAVVGYDEAAVLDQIAQFVNQSLQYDNLVAQAETVKAERLAETSERLNRWVAERGLTREQAVERIERAGEFADRAGVNLDAEFLRGNFDGAMNALNAFDALANEARRAELSHRFGQELLGLETTSVSEGLMVRAGDGRWVRESDLGPLPPPSLDLDRAARNATAMTGREFREYVAEPDEVAAAIRQVYKDSGIPDQEEAERKLFEARARAF